MPNGNATLADITSSDWQLMLDQNSPSGLPGSGIGNVVQGVADINQCIGIILSTPRGSDPLRPTFACDLWKWIDAPLQLARAYMVREIVSAITMWEPRVNVLSATVNLVPGDIAHLDITIVWQLNITAPAQSGPSTAQSLTITVPQNLG